MKNGVVGVKREVRVQTTPGSPDETRVSGVKTKTFTSICTGPSVVFNSFISVRFYKENFVDEIVVG